MILLNVEEINKELGVGGHIERKLAERKETSFYELTYYVGTFQENWQRIQNIVSEQESKAKLRWWMYDNEKIQFECYDNR